MKAIDKLSSKKFFVGVAAGIALYLVTRSFWVILAIVFLSGILDKLNERKSQSC